MSWQFTETVTWGELLWTCLACIGLVVHLILMLDAIKDKIALNASGQNGPRKLIADMNAIDDAGRAMLQFGFVVIGVLAMLNPSNPNTSGVNLLGATFAAVLIGGEIVLVAVSVYNLRGRYKLVSMMLEYGLLDTCQQENCPMRGHHPAHGEPVVPALQPGGVSVERIDDSTVIAVRDQQETNHGGH